MRLKRGRGYVSADSNFDEDLSLGYIPIDSVHTPVKKVNYNVEAARLGQNTEFDKLTIEVWTDGSVKPEDSIGLAAKLIKDHMSIFINFEEDTDDFAYAKMERPPLPRNDQLDRSVDELNCQFVLTTVSRTPTFARFAIWSNAPSARCWRPRTSARSRSTRSRRS